MEIVNKVKNSGLITIDLEDFLPSEQIFVGLDIKDQLWQGLALKEKDFRAYINTEDWSKYQDKVVHIYCSADAIVPPWAFMLLAAALQGHARNVVYGNREVAMESLVLQAIYDLNPEAFTGSRIVIKGCSKIPNIEKHLTAFTVLFKGEVQSIMYGEPCSTVPIYKAPKAYKRP